MTLAAVLVIATVTGTWGLQALHAQQPGIKRVDLQKQDLSVPGREVVQVRVEIERGAGIGRSTHPGEEVTYLMEGTMQLEVDGKPVQNLKAGEAFIIPAGVVHAAKNSGSTITKGPVTYIVEKGKPIATPVKCTRGAFPYPRMNLYRYTDSAVTRSGRRGLKVN